MVMMKKKKKETNYKNWNKLETLRLTQVFFSSIFGPNSHLNYITDQSVGRNCILLWHTASPFRLTKIQVCRAI